MKQHLNGGFVFGSAEEVLRDEWKVVFCVEELIHP